MATENRMILSEVCQALFVFTIIIFSFQEGLTFITQAAGLLLIIAFMYEVMFKVKDFKFTFPLPLLCFLGFVVYSMLSLIWTNQSVDFVATLLQLFLISFIMINIIHHMGHFRSITIGFLIALLIASIDMWNSMNGLVVTDDTVRISSFLGNANVFAISLFIGIILAVEALFHKRDNAGTDSRGSIALKLVLVSLIALFAYEIIFLTGSRKAMIAVFLFSFMYFFKYLLKVKFLQKLAIMVTGVLVMTGLLFVTQESVFYERLSMVFDMLSGKSVREGSLNERSSMITDGLGLWRENPIFGWGTDQFRYVSGYQTYSHNNFVEILSNNGLLGLVLYYSMIVFILIAGFKLIRSKHPTVNHYGWLNVTTILIVIFWDFALVSYYSKLHWVILSVIIGITYYVHSNPRWNPSRQSRHSVQV